jgi:uncharacterized protein YdaU (DUF1376 family)
VNYYERHLGDYARDTGHLSLMEHGAYSLLLDRYYATEKPIPHALVYRITRAVKPEEIAATDAVLAEFFVPRDIDGTTAYHNRRADEAIAVYRESQEDKAEKRDHEKERKARYRKRRRELFAKLREIGLFPDFNAPIEELEELVSQSCPAGQARGQDADVPVKGTANQTPDTRHQSPVKNSSLRSESSTAAPSTGDDGGGDSTAGSNNVTSLTAAQREARIAAVAADALETFNESKLTKAHGGLVPNVNPKVGAKGRRKQVARCIQIARDICAADYGSTLITREFWMDYWAVCLADEHKSGRLGGGKGHENWTPTFEYLTRPDTMQAVYDAATSREQGAAA